MESTENSVKLQELKVVPKIKKNIVSVGILIQYLAEMESNIGIMNDNNKGTRMKCRI